MTEPDDDDDTCWECGGHLSYVETKANGILCRCDYCGEELVLPDEDDDEEDD